MFSERITLHKCLTIWGSPEKSQTSSSYVSEIVKVEKVFAALDQTEGLASWAPLRFPKNFPLTQTILDNDTHPPSSICNRKKNSLFTGCLSKTFPIAVLTMINVPSVQNVKTITPICLSMSQFVQEEAKLSK